MAELENNKDLMSVLWSGADILRSKMDANEYKNYLLGIVFYKYLSDSFLIKAYDLIYDEKPETLKIALDAYKEAVEDESGEELKEEIQNLHIQVLHRQQMTIHSIENSCRKHLIISSKVMRFLQIYLQTLIYIPIV